jgi:hypothetical protein
MSTRSNALTTANFVVKSYHDTNSAIIGKIH